MRFSRLVLFSAFAAATLFAQTNVTGIWKLQIPMGDGTYQDRFLNLTKNGDQISGEVVRSYSPHKIKTGSFENGRLHFEVNPWRDVIDSYDAVLKGDKLEVTITTDVTSNSHGGVQKGEATHDTAEHMNAPTAPPLPARHDVADNNLVRTPPMGWNSWNHFAGRVNDQVVRHAADAIVSSGMKDAGYIYVNIDDTWQGERDANGVLQANNKFPDMKALADYVHSKGLKIGLYSSPGPKTCASYEGSMGHEEQDAKTYASWGFDYLKYDWCSAGKVYKQSDLQAAYQKMGQALLESGRPIVYSLCEYGDGDVWTWGATVGGNLWRTTGDIGDSWKSMEEIGFGQIKIAQYAQPGHWNDPDMLEIGNGGLNKDESETHMTLWVLLSAPLLAGNDLDHMSKDTLELLTNKDVIAIDQDPAVKHPKRTQLDGNTEAWTREMADGSTVLALFNREDAPKTVAVKWADLGLQPGTNATNLWTHQGVTLSGDSYSTTVPRHGVVLLRITKVD